MIGQGRIFKSEFRYYILLAEVPREIKIKRFLRKINQYVNSKEPILVHSTNVGQVVHLFTRVIRDPDLFIYMLIQDPNLFIYRTDPGSGFIF